MTEEQQASLTSIGAMSWVLARECGHLTEVALFVIIIVGGLFVPIMVHLGEV